MAGRVKEIISETHEARVKFFIEHPDFFTSLDDHPKSDIIDILVDAKGKGIVGGPLNVLKDAKELNVDSPAEANVQNKEVIQKETASVHISVDTQNIHVIDVEDTSSPDQNEQVEDIANEVPAIENVAPSDKAISAKENDIEENKSEEKDKEKKQEGEKEKVDQTEISASTKSSDNKGEESGKELAANTSLLAINTSHSMHIVNVEQKNITDMSSTELMMIVAQKMIKGLRKSK